MGTGLNYTVPTSGYDLSDDGVDDLSLQRNVGGFVAGHTIYSGTNGAVHDSFNFGLDTDFLIGGNYSVSNLGDITTGRNEAGTWVWRTRETGSGTELEAVSFGLSSDWMVGGDYDGDGYVDIAVFHPNANPGESGFMIRPSSNTTTPWEITYGASNDYPLTNFQVH